MYARIFLNFLYDSYFIFYFLQVVPAGIVHLHMERFGDHFTWSKITTCIHNVVVGKLWIDNYGEIVIRNHSTGDISRIRIHKASGKEQGQLSGKVKHFQRIFFFTIF